MTLVAAGASRVIAVTKIAYTRSARPTEAWVEDVAQAITEDVEGPHGEQDREPGKQRQPRLRADEVPTLADHHAPLRRRRLGTEADETEPGRRDDRRAHVETRLDEQRRDRVREEMAREDPPRRRPDAPSGLYVLAAPQRKKLPAREACVDGPRDGGDGDDRVREAWPERACDRHREDQRRE